MADFSEAAWLWFAKGAGAVAGSAISLAYLLPKDGREAAARFAVGVVSGVVFGGTAGIKVAKELGIADVLSASEVLIMGSAVASVSAWWALGFLLRSFSRASFRGAIPGKDDHAR